MNKEFKQGFYLVSVLIFCFAAGCTFFLPLMNPLFFIYSLLFVFFAPYFSAKLDKLEKEIKE